MTLRNQIQNQNQKTMSLKNINFKQPKYIIPLVLLPFVFFFMWLISNHQNKQEAKEVETLATSEGYNITIPSPEKEEDIENKIDNVDRFFNDERSSTKTYLNELGEEKEDEGIVVNLLTAQELAMKDSIDKAKSESYSMVESHQKMINDLIKKADRDSEGTDISPNHKKTVDNIVNNKTKEAQDILDIEFENAKAPSPKDDMEDFKNQIRYIDSLQFPEKYQKKIVEKIEEKTFAKLSTGQQENSRFNTISNQKKRNSIKALLDEGIIVYGGSRVRLRLMNEVYLNDLYLKKGTYLYGEVKAFRNQRVLITIPSILVNGEIVETNISLYDLDGLEGIFVPQSSFRAFVNELGGKTSTATGGTSINNNNQQQSLKDQFLFETATNTIKVTTKALERAIKRNKARFKYNSQVILQNKK